MEFVYRKTYCILRSGVTSLALDVFVHLVAKNIMKKVMDSVVVFFNTKLAELVANSTNGY